MIFRRRIPADFWERARIFLWPRRSFGRSALYIKKRILRLSATPHAVAAGVAAGVFASFLPFMGTHFVIAAAVAFIIRGNMLASALGTAVGNPLTFPFIWGATYELGRFILYGRHPGDIEPLHLGKALWHLEFTQLWTPLLKPMTAGGVPLGLLFGLVFYGLTRWATSAFQRQRRKRLLARSAPGRARAISQETGA
ncbi:MAG: DUF2062 domain-containing protein [Mesorhizobium sp.]|nr:DUF2062 domain-containing protein [Mesorhizobium sp.]